MFYADYATNSVKLLPRETRGTLTVLDIAPQIDAIAAPWMTQKEHMNLVIGVVQNGHQWTNGWGTFQSLDGRAMGADEHTVFEVGSITKVFTAVLLARLVEQGDLAFDTPISQLGQIYQTLPDTVTLASLITHTSGLPRLPSNLTPSFRQDPENPYAAYTFDDLHAYLQGGDRIPRKTTGRISYSNLGVGILGNILADHVGKSYEEAVIQHVCNPLGLSDTRITLNESQQARFVPGYTEDGKPTKPWDLPVLAGAGALRSTVQDLLMFVTANLQPETSAIAPALLKTHEMQTTDFAPTPGFFGLVENVARVVRRVRGNPLVRYKPVGVSLGWFVDFLSGSNHTVYTFTGGTGGHRSFCGFIKETQTGVVVLSNYADPVESMFGRYSVDRVGLKMLEMVDRCLPPS